MYTLPKYEWVTQRELCKRCKHYQERRDDPRYHSAALVMLCTKNPRRARRGIGTCIDNRTTGPCGIDGKLFQLKEN